MSFTAYVRGIVEEKGSLLLGRGGDKAGGEVAVCSFQIQEVHGLLLDDFIVHQRDQNGAQVALPKAFHVRREAGQIVTRTLWGEQHGSYATFVYFFLQGFVLH